MNIGWFIFSHRFNQIDIIGISIFMICITKGLFILGSVTLLLSVFLSVIGEKYYVNRRENSSDKV